MSGIHAMNGFIDTPPHDPADLGGLTDLLNPWQRRFPLVADPFRLIAGRTARTEAAVIDAFAQARDSGLLSRLGGVFDPRAGGDSLLCAIAVPPGRLDAVAAIVSERPGVNHNYAREDVLNLWFVLTSADRQDTARTLWQLQQRIGLPIVQLRMLRAYRIDLGFDLRGVPDSAGAPGRTLPQPDEGLRALPASVIPLRPEDQALAALVEQGLPLEPRPYRAWARQLGQDDCRPLRSRLVAWLADGRLRRFGAVLRHHEAGIASNAMTVFDVPDALRDAAGARLASQPGITLAYARERAPGWPFNLYCMVHGRDRAAVCARIDAATAAAGLAPWPRRMLFSSRRYKQTGARRFTAPRPLPDRHPEVFCHDPC
jgi:DNA-binding Lrp family transcriptional regulator